MHDPIPTDTEKTLLNGLALYETEIRQKLPLGSLTPEDILGVCAIPDPKNPYAHIIYQVNTGKAHFFIDFVLDQDYGKSVKEREKEIITGTEILPRILVQQGIFNIKEISADGISFSEESSGKFYFLNNNGEKSEFKEENHNNEEDESDSIVYREPEED